jgi:hypothetical protein
MVFLVVFATNETAAATLPTANTTPPWPAAPVASAASVMASASLRIDTMSHGVVSIDPGLFLNSAAAAAAAHALFAAVASVANCR